MKKGHVIFTILLLVVTSKVSAFSTNIDVDDYSLKAGEEFTATVSIEDADNGVASADYTINFDEDIFEVVSVAYESSVTENDFLTNITTDYIKISYVDSQYGSNALENGDILKVTFEVKTSASTGDYTISITGSGYGDSSANSLTSTYADVSVYVSALSSVAKLSTLSINSENITLTDNVYAYSLTVYYDEAIISATASNNGSVTLPNDLSLDFGENELEIIVEAEDGTVKTYTITITREEVSNNSSDIINALDSMSYVTVKVESTDYNKVISTTILAKLISSSEYLKYNVYNEFDEISYYVLLNAENISSSSQINYEIDFESDNEDIIDSLNYSINKFYISFESSDLLDGSLDFGVNVSEMFENSETLSLYSYSDEEITLVDNSVSVTSGMALINVTSLGEYLLVSNDEMSFSLNVDSVYEENESIILTGIVINENILSSDETFYINYSVNGVTSNEVITFSENFTIDLSTNENLKSSNTVSVWLTNSEKEILNAATISFDIDSEDTSVNPQTGYIINTALLALAASVSAALYLKVKNKKLFRKF